MPYRVLGAFMLVFGLFACSAPSPVLVPQTGTPTAPVSAVATITPTPLPTASSAPTATRTITPSPTSTRFITPPSPGQTAAIPILMYHHLAELPDTASETLRTWTVSPRDFELQMQWLADQGFHTVTMSQIGAFFKRNQPLPVKPIVISFDDGWEDGYKVAFPILSKLHMSGTFFVYTQALDHKPFLSWQEFDEMAAAGMDFQSHTVTHARLRTIAADAALKELVDSKALLEKRLGRPVTTLAYPDGEYNAAVIELVKKAGYESAVTIASGYKQRADELYTLHRIRVSYTDTLQVVISRLP